MKKIRKIFLSGIIAVAAFQILSAQIIEGIVTNRSNKKHIELANIGVLNTKVGTYSDEDGRFILELPAEIQDSILVVSAIGFNSQKVDLSEIDLNEMLEIALIPKNYDLGSFTVKESRIKTNSIGNRVIRGRLGKMAYTSDWFNKRFGRSIAIKVNLSEDPPFRIDELAVGIYENPWKETRYRCRFVRVDPKTGEPGEELTNASMIVTFDEEFGWVEFKFEEQKPFIREKEFFLLVENIDDRGEKRNPDQLASPAPIYMFNFFTFSKQPVYLSDEGLQVWERVGKDPTFRLKYAYE